MLTQSPYYGPYSYNNGTYYVREIYVNIRGGDTIGAGRKLTQRWNVYLNSQTKADPDIVVDVTEARELADLQSIVRDRLDGVQTS